MTNELISFETAAIAKEKGYDIPENYYFRRWYKEIQEREGGCLNYNETEPTYNEDFYSRPEQSTLQRWLRENHDIHINLTHSYTKGKKDLGFYYHIESAKYNFMGGYTYDDNYESILEKALQEGLKLIK